jgi:uncharacterized Zn finger protein (UPF0148 family)
MNATEIECPICDRKVQSDITRCPNCGADLLLSSFEDLEELARNISTNDNQKQPEAKVDPKKPSPETTSKVEENKKQLPEKERKEEPQSVVEPMKEEKATSDSNKDESKHGLGRLFGKKKK